MMFFPPEYKDRATMVHKMATALAAICIVGTILGMIAAFAFRGSGLSENMRRFMAITILSGAPVGLILIAIVNISLSRRYRAHLLDVQSRERGNALPLSSRQELLKAMQCTRYDYHKQSRSFSIMVTGIIAIAVVLFIVLYAAYPGVKLLMIGCFLLLILAVEVSIGKKVLSKRWQNVITLTEVGIQFTEGNSRRVLPWDSLTEIKADRYGYLIRSSRGDLNIWNGIGPAEVGERGFFEKLIIEPYSKKLIDQIKVMNPKVVYVEPFLARKLNVPVSDKIVAKFIIVVVVLFFVVIIASMFNLFR